MAANNRGKIHRLRLTQLLPLLAVFACGCASYDRKMDWIATAPVFPPGKTEEVPVFHARSEVKHPFGVIGLLRGWFVQPSETSELQLQADMARETAAQNGADAVLLSEGSTAIDRPASPHGKQEKAKSYIYGVAIKYFENLTPQDKQRILDWEKANSGSIEP
jgi:hypothetical protein